MSTGEYEMRTSESDYLSGRSHLRGLGVSGRIIWKLIIKKWDPKL